MKILSLVLFLFLLAAFAIGAGITDVERANIEETFDNVSEIVYNISFKEQVQNLSIPNARGLLLILEKYIHFVYTAGIEVIKAGIYFGQENPDYFEPSFIYKIIYVIIILIIIGLLIKPVTYFVVLIVLGVMYLKERSKKRRRRKQENEL